MNTFLPKSVFVTSGLVLFLALAACATDDEISTETTTSAVASPDETAALEQLEALVAGDPVPPHCDTIPSSPRLTAAQRHEARTTCATYRALLHKIAEHQVTHDPSGTETAKYQEAVAEVLDTMYAKLVEIVPGR